MNIALVALRLMIRDVSELDEEQLCIFSSDCASEKKVEERYIDMAKDLLRDDTENTEAP